MSTEYILTKDGKLMHTQRLAYVDLDEGELVHFKYIKREKLPNGKWRYYYDAKQMRKDFQDATGITAKKNYKEAQKKADESKEALATAKKNREGTLQYHKAVVEDHKKAGVSADKMDDAKRKAVIAKDLLSRSDVTNQTSALLVSTLADKRVEKLEAKDRSLKEKSEQRLKKAIDMVREAGSTEMKAARARYEAGVEYVKARNAFLETPLGKLESAINSGLTWFTNLFKKRKKT